MVSQLPPSQIQRSTLPRRQSRAANRSHATTRRTDHTTSRKDSPQDPAPASHHRAPTEKSKSKTSSPNEATATRQKQPHLQKTTRLDPTCNTRPLDSEPETSKPTSEHKGDEDAATPWKGNESPPKANDRH